MTTRSDREVWLRGPLPDFPGALQPVAHALLQAEEELRRILRDIPNEAVWVRPADAASVGFHVLHIAGSLDRLLTYARGEQLDDMQRAALRDETQPRADQTAESLGEIVSRAIGRALDQLRSTREEELDAPRTVGRAGHPSTVRGLLYHAGEHTARHVGQAITTARVAAAGMPHGHPEGANQRTG